MTISIPSGFFDNYYEAVDFLLETPEIGKSCTVTYETKNNSDYDVFSEENFTNELETDTVKLRIYYTPKNWVKTSDNIQWIDGRIQILGYMSDVEKIKKSSYVVIEGYNYKLATNPLRHGFGQRYFIAFMDLI